MYKSFGSRLDHVFRRFHVGTAVASERALLIAVLCSFSSYAEMIHSWPNLNDSEQPDCGFFSCNDDADEGSFYTKDQRQIVNVYEVRYSVTFITKKVHSM